jgi:hypothetical protein
LSSCEELKHGQKRIAEDVRTMVSHGSFLFSIEDDDLDDEDEENSPLPLRGIPPLRGGQEEGAGGKADGAAGKAHGRRRSEDSERFRTLGEAIGAELAAEGAAPPVGCADTPREEGGEIRGAEELRVDL